MRPLGRLSKWSDQEKEMYDYLIAGSGLYGAVFANVAASNGKSVLVLEKRPNIGAFL